MTKVSKTKGASGSEFAGRTYIVTGGGSGIGRAIALALGAADARVVVAGRTPLKLEETVALIEKEGGQALAVPTDVRDPAAVDALVAAATSRFGQLDGLVNNAAGNFVAPGIDISPNGWRAVVDIVLNGSYYCTRAVARQLRDQGTGGSVLSVIATYAWHGHPGTVHSAAAKAGVLAMTRTLAVELAPLGIRLNCIAPGPTETAGAGAALWATDEARAEVLATVPAGRFAAPAEIADASLFLLGERASYVTGECLTVDGGQWLGKQVYGRTGAAAP
ncbi:SDR family oxidoreductase [Streptomyces sp. ISL-96]|uniref:SDR family oxidoreductase n=1 Tax=Streptomyces sp. ISL-96 TaxID=2819191 RepID=UPI001BE6ECE9|nr:SDR family oxidoreductase [Streptomyces sp. ISL-96]MBT2487976.1 SDR family oxidoreductase [Streptomyces sp. ISL-96]